MGEFYVPPEAEGNEETASVATLPEPIKRAIIPTNIPVIPGAVVFLNRSACGGAIEHLLQRPLIVLKVMQNVPVSQILCVQTGSSGNMPGIQIHLQSKYGWIGGKATSYCYPWSLISVTPRDIKEVATYIKPEVLAAIDQAVAYHMGYNSEVPPYLDEQLNAVEYYRPTNVKYLNPDRQTELDHDPNLQLSPTKIVDIGEEDEDEDKVTVVKEPHVGPRLAAIVKDLQDTEIAMIISRTMTNQEIATQYKISAPDASRLRTFLEDTTATVATMKSVYHKTRNMKVANNLLNQCERIVLAVYMNAELLRMPEKTYKIMQESTIRAYNIDLNSPRWSYRKKAMERLQEEWKIKLVSLK